MRTPEQIREYKRQWAAKKRATDPGFKSRERSHSLRYHERNKEVRLAASREWKSKNKDKQHEYRLNKEEIKQSRQLPEYRETKNKRSRTRYQLDLAYQLEKRLRATLNQSLRRVKAPKSQTTINLIGCTIEELKVHLASNFKYGMSWDRFREIHIDHIRPCASFDLTDPEQQKICFHFSNLQPLWAADNLRKSAKYEPKTNRA